mmetsp:Transcript_5965/g.14165  ORF Transcript_5965/g.14165 Transcript_5965/m.14165 type:complete len:225 (-) Transcript_5965:1091-1765(-)
MLPDEQELDAKPTNLTSLHALAAFSVPELANAPAQYTTNQRKVPPRQLQPRVHSAGSNAALHLRGPDTPSSGAHKPRLPAPCRSSPSLTPCVTRRRTIHSANLLYAVTGVVLAQVEVVWREAAGPQTSTGVLRLSIPLVEAEVFVLTRHGVAVIVTLPPSKVITRVKNPEVHHDLCGAVRDRESLTRGSPDHCPVNVPSDGCWQPLKGVSVELCPQVTRRMNRS